MSIPAQTRPSVFRILCVAFQQPLQNPRAAVVNIAVCRFKVARIPRVGYVPAVIGKIHELSDLILRVAAEQAHHIADICAIHADEKIVFFIIVRAELYGAFSLARKPMPLQFALCGRSSFFRALRHAFFDTQNVLSVFTGVGDLVHAVLDDI